MKRMTIFAIWLVVGLLLSGCMTTIPKRQPMTAWKMTARTTTALSVPISATMPPPQPMPTAASRLSFLIIQMPHTTLHGHPPFDAALTATLSYDLNQQLADCQQIIWDFGDGRRLSQPCPPPGESYTTLTASHQYTQPDAYFARVQMEMRDGRVIESDKTQTVLVAEGQPVSWGGRILYWIVWLGAMGLATAGALWLRRRPRRFRLQWTEHRVRWFFFFLSFGRWRCYRCLTGCCCIGFGLVAAFEKRHRSSSVLG